MKIAGTCLFPSRGATAALNQSYLVAEATRLPSLTLGHASNDEGSQDTKTLWIKLEDAAGMHGPSRIANVGEAAGEKGA